MEQLKHSIVLTVEWGGDSVLMEYGDFHMHAWRHEKNALKDMLSMIEEIIEGKLVYVQSEDGACFKEREI